MIPRLMIFAPSAYESSLLILAPLLRRDSTAVVILLVYILKGRQPYQHRVEEPSMLVLDPLRHSLHVSITPATYGQISMVNESLRL